jgi:hypothetical protein
MTQGFAKKLTVSGSAGVGTINPGTINQLAYYAASGTTLSGLTTANNGVLVTSGTGVPSISNTIGAGLTMPSITFNSTSGIIGTTTNNNAAAGSVGEFISSQIVAASSVSLTTATNTNVTSISLTAGDWDVWGNTTYLPQVTVTNVAGSFAWISTTSATVPDPSLYQGGTYSTSGTVANTNFGYTAPSQRLSLSATTTVYLSVRASFTAGTLSVCGGIYARRVR